MPAGRTAPRAGRAAAGLAIATGLAVAGCSQAPPAAPPGPSASASASATPSGGASASVSSNRPLAPLTGLPAASSADAGRPAVALAVAGASPQGLSSADVVFQEMASTVRYIAVYQSSEGSTVGPITSTDPTDRGALSVLHPLLGYSGAAAPFLVTMLDKSKVKDAGDAHYASAYQSGSGGLTTTPQAISAAVRGDTAPPPLFFYRGSGTGGSALASHGQFTATSASVSIPGHSTEQWTFQPHSDRWALTSGGPAVQVANLVVQMVSYKTITLNARHGVTVPDAQVVGGGKAEVLSGSVSGGSAGTGAQGTWSKPHSGLVTNYFDSSGSLMAFTPGPTWVILAPPGTKVSTSG